MVLMPSSLGMLCTIKTFSETEVTAQVFIYFFEYVPNIKTYSGLGGTVAQTVAPTTFGLEAHGGHGFESGLM